MTDKQLRKMILAIITAADYDLAKSFGRGAEDPALAKQTMQAMIGIARKHGEAIEAAARAEGWEQGREAEMEQCVEFVRNGAAKIVRNDGSQNPPPSLAFWLGCVSDALELSREAAAVARSRAAAKGGGR